MNSASSGNNQVNLEVNDTDDSSMSEWAQAHSSFPPFVMNSPLTSSDSFSALNIPFQIESHFNDQDNLRMWSPPDDQILSGSTDSDTSVNYRDKNQPCVTNTHITTSLASSQTRVIVIGPSNGSPPITDKKWMPQSPESSRFFRDVRGHSDIPTHYSGFDNLDKFVSSDASPNAIAVTHGSPLDLSFPVKDSRAECHDSAGSAGLGLGIAQGQRRGSLGEHPSIAYIAAPIGSPSLRSTSYLTSTSAKSCLDLLTQERQILDPVSEV